jgi:hypothetical protein
MSTIRKLTLILLLGLVSCNTNYNHDFVYSVEYSNGKKESLRYTRNWHTPDCNVELFDGCVYFTWRGHMHDPNRMKAIVCDVRKFKLLSHKTIETE